MGGGDTSFERLVYFYFLILHSNGDLFLYFFASDSIIGPFFCLRCILVGVICHSIGINRFQFSSISVVQMGVKRWFPPPPSEFFSSPVRRLKKRAYLYFFRNENIFFSFLAYLYFFKYFFFLLSSAAKSHRFSLWLFSNFFFVHRTISPQRIPTDASIPPPSLMAEDFAPDFDAGSQGETRNQGTVLIAYVYIYIICNYILCIFYVIYYRI